MSHSDKGAAHQWPVTTLAVFAVTAAVTASQLRIPSLVPALQRFPNEIAHREYWRLITSLLVHDEGWRQVVFNLIMLIVAGTWAERIFRGREWLLLYLSAGILGQVAGLYWQPRGAGNSVAVCGLVGAVACWMLRSTRLQFRFGGALLLCGGALLTYLRDIHGPPLFLGAAIAQLILSRQMRSKEGLTPPDSI